MLAVKGVFEQGQARPVRRIQGREGQPVIITFLDEPAEPLDAAQFDTDNGWQSMVNLIDSCAVETGVRDLAHRHDDYLHHTPPAGA